MNVCNPIQSSYHSNIVINVTSVQDPAAKQEEMEDLEEDNSVYDISSLLSSLMEDDIEDLPEDNSVNDASSLLSSSMDDPIPQDVIDDIVKMTEEYARPIGLQITESYDTHLEEDSENEPIYMNVEEGLSILDEYDSSLDTSWWTEDERSSDTAEEPVEETAEETAEVPAEETAGEPAEETAEVPAKGTAEEPAEETAEVPAEDMEDTPCFAWSCIPRIRQKAPANMLNMCIDL
ncbi:uncharacterized protein [Engystomops pustulosus]|uniref:uncharacterized protein n=1 Tax=Engystomops pustulosus TaxID=76066 RepID=UPI003AFB575C